MCRREASVDGRTCSEASTTNELAGVTVAECGAACEATLGCRFFSYESAAALTGWCVGCGAPLGGKCLLILKRHTKQTGFVTNGLRICGGAYERIQAPGRPSRQWVR